MSAYLKFFQLEKSPFDTKAQSNLVLGTKALREAFAEIDAGLRDGAPRICVDGKKGLGKTSLARALPKLLGETARVVLILNPSLPWSTLRSAIVKQLDLAEGNLSRKTLVRARAEGRRLVIAIDQAERISSESLDHLDILLGYRNDDDEQLVHCVLLANLQAAASQHNEQGEQTPLLWWLDKLNTLQLEFQPIPVTGVSSYVQKHLKRAGWKGGQIFTPDALQTIHRLTGGVPREMSELCGRALELAGEEQAQGIDAGMVEDVFGEIPLEELAEGEDDVTDTAFVGARDDDALANTSTFAAKPVRAPASRSTWSEDATEAMPSTGRREDPSPGGAPASSGDDPRIERMPSPGRSVHAPVEAPISLDTFFGDSLDGGSASASAPRSTAPGSTQRPGAEATGAESAFDEPFEDGPHGRSWLKWVGIAAGLLMLIGAGSFAALSLLGGDELEAADVPAVLARPKPPGTTGTTPAPATVEPIAGIEPVPARADSDSSAVHPGDEARDAAAFADARDPLEALEAGAPPDRAGPKMTDELVRAAGGEAPPSSAEPARAAAAGAPGSAASDLAAAASGERRATPDAGAQEPVPAAGTADDPLLGFEGASAGPGHAAEVADSPAASAPASPAPGGPRTSRAEPDAPASRQWQNPADTRVDAPFW